MGFEPPQNVYRLVFEDDLAGLEVRARSVSVGAFLKIAELADLLGRQPTAEDVPRIRQLFTGFADALLGWNLEADGQPVPATYEGMCSQDFGLVLRLINAWMERVGGVAPPLPRPSADGALSLEASLPMVPLSESQAS